MFECKLCHEMRGIQERGLCEECSDYSDEQVFKQNLLDGIQDTTLDLLYKEEAFLRKFGWDSTCDLPDCCWRWVKTIKGQTIAVSLSDALNIEKNIVHYKSDEAPAA